MVTRRDVHEQIKAANTEVSTDSTEAPADPSGAVPPSDSSAATVKEPKAPKAKAEPVDCVCKVPDNGPVNADGKHKYPGCNGAKSTRKFAPGHDAKLVGYLTRQYEAGQISAEDAIAQVREKSGNSALLVGKIKSAVKAVDERKAAKAKRAEKVEADKVAGKTPEDEVNDQAVALAEAASV